MVNLNKNTEIFLEKNNIDIQFLKFNNKKYFYISMDNPDNRNYVKFISLKSKICCFYYTGKISFFKLTNLKSYNKESDIILKKLINFSNTEFSIILEYYLKTYSMLNLDIIIKYLRSNKNTKNKELYSSVFLFISLITDYFKSINDKRVNDFYKLYYEKYFDDYMFSNTVNRRIEINKHLIKILNDKNFVNLIQNIEEIFLFLK